MEREILFIDAKTPDEQLAIQTCPGYDGACEKAETDTFKMKEFADSAENCPRRGRCKVKVYFDSFIERYTFMGQCLME